MAQVALFTFDDESKSELTDSDGNVDNSGTLVGDAYSDGNGVGHFDGDGDYGIVDPDPMFDLNQGTIAIEFTQSEPSPGNAPWTGAHTLFSSDANGYGSTNGDHLSIYIKANGEICIRHQTNGTDYYYSGGSVVPGEPVQMTYSFGPDGSTLTVDGQVKIAAPYEHSMAGGTNGMTVGASLASSTEGTSDKINGFFEGEISRVAIYDTVETFNDAIPCFLAGTPVLTPSGEVAVETLKVGDLVTTLDGGAQAVVWITTSTVDRLTLRHNQKMRPIELDVPTVTGPRKLALSRQHCVMMIDGHREVLVRAAHLEKHGMATRARANAPVTYVHIMLEHHHVVCADGIPCETLRAGKLTERLVSMPKTPGQKSVMPVMEPARPVLSGAEVRAAVRAGRLEFAFWQPQGIQKSA
ncbi:Hint domain-containing protein [Shimia sp. Alg240-R146]|uniref:Hint domain-containing protein n=1 Tax=Shimia sp. Alg240-R146 TaxID=2993449 RepID=UPI0022DF15DB|nr:Hint domain-containing protein [Shimia sp. Alg240-R146]